MAVRPSRFCTLVLAWCRKPYREGGEKGMQQLEQWEAQLDMPLPGDTFDDHDLEADGEAFMALMKSQAG